MRIIKETSKKHQMNYDRQDRKTDIEQIHHTIKENKEREERLMIEITRNQNKNESRNERERERLKENSKLKRTLRTEGMNWSR